VCSIVLTLNSYRELTGLNPRDPNKLVRTPLAQKRMSIMEQPSRRNSIEEAKAVMACMQSAQKQPAPVTFTSLGGGGSRGVTPSPPPPRPPPGSVTTEALQRMVEEHLYYTKKCGLQYPPGCLACVYAKLNGRAEDVDPECEQGVFTRFDADNNVYKIEPCRDVRLEFDARYRARTAAVEADAAADAAEVAYDERAKRASERAQMRAPRRTSERARRRAPRASAEASTTSDEARAQRRAPRRTSERAQRRAQRATGRERRGAHNFAQLR
jgi:hypothetical protein